MGNISTFGTYALARLGIYAAQSAVTITGNNISNINTKGYTRQAIDQFSLNMGGADRYQSKWSTRIGSGAFVAGVTQLRDPYLDIRYRNEQTNLGHYEGWIDGLNQVAGVLDEVGRGDDEAGIMEARFNELIQQMQNLDTMGAGKDEFDTLVRSACTSIVNTFHSYANQLQTQLRNADKRFRQDLEKVNTILERIRDLNSSIRKTEIYGGNALEVKDERNNLLDELSEYIGINVTYEQDKVGEGLYVDRLVVTTDSEPPYTLINGVYAAELSIKQVPDVNPDGTPKVDANGDPVMVDSPNYDLHLGPLLDKYDRLIKGGNKDGEDIGDDDLHGKLNAEREILTEEGEYTDDAVLNGTDSSAAFKRGIPYYQKALNTLANTFANVLNKANIEAAQAMGIYDDYDDPNTFALFSNDGNKNTTGNPPIDAFNISISYTWSVHEARMLETRKEWEGEIPSTANDNLQYILALLTNDVPYYKEMYGDYTQVGQNPPEKPDDLTFRGTFQEFLTTHMAGTLANDMNTYQTMLDNHEINLDNLYIDRDSIMGVDLNDEAMNLMQYQKAYQAACRLMTVYDTMLDKLINGT